MFSSAYSIASQFIAPVVLSRKTVGNQCSSSIGTFVFINDEGWILTAGHIIAQMQQLQTESNQVRQFQAEKDRIENDQALNRNQRRQQLRQLGRLDQNLTERFSSWWGLDGVQLVDAGYLGSIDIGMGRMEPFDPAWVTRYPVFKDPTVGMDTGTSLCKLGFPFHSIVPDWDANTDRFVLPPDATPLPRFPIEGMYTRDAEVPPPGNQPPPYRLLYIETSTPGLRGQSGGPIFDVQGTIWAIQSMTSHLPLGFSPPVPGGKKGEKEHQFLNVGMGVHVETILGLMNERGIRHEVSAY